MYENVVAAALSYFCRTKAIRRDSAAENDFYQRFANPYPRWFVGLLRFMGKRKTAGGGIAAALKIGSGRSASASGGQNFDRSCPTQYSQAGPVRCGTRSPAVPGSPLV